MATTPFSAVEDAFTQVLDALEHLNSTLRSQAVEALTGAQMRGTQAAWDRKQELKTMNKELREAYQQSSKICTTIGNLAVKPKRDQSGRSAINRRR